ncbi:hydantoinase/oxoprolinase family protein [Nonomuraea sp. NPDC049152]|uniref:hydantoinase/oxoprolinase family protein n=1 Tax=Nonomuraea sp. NPDC049152 TaxID=3154350 RepID=UPI0033C28CEA
MEYQIGVDVGGTFTDAVLRGPHGEVSVAKCLSTPGDPLTGIMSSISQVLEDATPSLVKRVVHATTLATNAVLERTGVRVAFVTTRGFRSVIPLGRYARVEEDRYDLRFTPPIPPVAAEDCFEVDERVAADGSVLVPLSLESVRRAGREIAARGITSAAVCLLHSYAAPAHERQVAAVLKQYVPDVVISSEVWPEFREYERATTTIMSAYVGPLMSSYLSRLREGLASLGITAPVHVMESGGGVMSATQAARRAVATIESGPAAGVLAAALTGHPEVISFDMGGTTAKTCVIRNGRPEITHEFHVGGKGSFGGRRAGTGVPVKTPAIDLAEVGAGGGSIAWVDTAGALRVGPRSAGSSPGPACYGLGGSAPTVTDANLVLGYLSPGSFTAFPLSAEPAEKALDGVAGPLGVSREAAAHAVHEIVGAAMGSAVHVVTVQRGIDPRGFVMVAFGGAGPMHAARVAERFGIGTVVVPALCGVASAAGLLAGELSTERVLSALSAPDPEAVFGSLESAARDDLAITADSADVRVERSVDVRFRGQAHELTVPWGPSVASAFFEKYRQVYGIAQEGEIELVGFRLRLSVSSVKDTAWRIAREPSASPGRRAAYFAEHGGYVEVPVLTRAALTRLAGPAIVEDPESTIVVPPGWSAALADDGAVVLTRTTREEDPA